MKFTIEMVNEYLTIVNDENPIHRSIVPGQLICEKVFSELNNIDEEVQFLIKENDEIIVFKTYDDIKLTITRS
ncbi:MAG: hypothetical protein E7H03_05090 [Staphylococcus epidermidis]|nr:hypothetical protein [Staphylococcus epidermidis]